MLWASVSVFTVLNHFFFLFFPHVYPYSIKIRSVFYFGTWDCWMIVYVWWLESRRPCQECSVRLTVCWQFLLWFGMKVSIKWISRCTKMLVHRDNKQNDGRCRVLTSILLWIWVYANWLVSLNSWNNKNLLSQLLLVASIVGLGFFFFLFLI